MKGKDSAFLPLAAQALETLEAFDAKDRLEEICQGICTSSTLYLEAFDALDVKARMVSYIRNHPREFID